MDKIYNKTTWENKPSTKTKVNAENLNHIENGIDAIDTRVAEIGTDVGQIDDDVTAMKNKLDTVQEGAEVNQNAYAFFNVGENVLSANAKQSAITFVAGNNVTLTPNVNDNSLEISAKGGGGGGDVPDNVALYKEATTPTSEAKLKADGLKVNDSYTFKVELDGDGRVCYRGADDSLIPFNRGGYVDLLKDGIKDNNARTLSFECPRDIEVLYVNTRYYFYSSSYSYSMSIIGSTTYQLPYYQVDKEEYAFGGGASVNHRAKIMNLKKGDIIRFGSFYDVEQFNPTLYNDYKDRMFAIVSF